MHFSQSARSSICNLSSVEGRSLEEVTSTIQATFHEDYGDVNPHDLKEAIRAFLEVTLSRNNARLEEALLEELPSDEAESYKNESELETFDNIPSKELKATDSAVSEPTKATDDTKKEKLDSSSKEGSTAPKESFSTKDEDKSTNESELVTLTKGERAALGVAIFIGFCFMFPKPAKLLWQLFVCSFCVCMVATMFSSTSGTKSA